MKEDLIESFNGHLLESNRELKNVLREDVSYTGKEFAVKLRADIKEDDLLNIGAKRTGSTIQNDKYYISENDKPKDAEETVRVRKEGSGDTTLTYKGPKSSDEDKLRKRCIVESSINNGQIKEVTDDLKKTVEVSKKRVNLTLNQVRISLDEIDGLGKFVELEVNSVDHSHLIYGVLSKLGYSSQEATTLSYYKLSLLEMNSSQKLFLTVQEKIGNAIFGTTSAALTTLGTMIGVASASPSVSAIIGAILSVGIAGSSSDSLAIYNQKRAEKGAHDKNALQVAFGTFMSEFVFSLLFILPFLILDKFWALGANICFAVSLIIFVNIYTAIFQKESILKTVLRNLLLALVVSGGAYYAGKLLRLILGL